MLNSTLVSYAILKANWDKGKQYLDSFVPIVAECIRISSDEIISASQLKIDIKKKFGIDIPQNAIKQILKRVRKQGYIKYNNKNQVYMRDIEELDKLTFSQHQKEFLTAHSYVVESLSSFALCNYEINWSKEQSESALLSYLEAYQITLLGATVYRRPLELGLEPDNFSNYIIGSFIQFAYDNNLPEFFHIETLVKGNMLANMIYLPDPNKASMKFKNTSVYLDTSFLIFALGYAGQARKDPCTELLELLRQAGAKLKCFSHNANEIRGILRVCQTRLIDNDLDGLYGHSADTMDYFIMSGTTPSDIEDIITRLDSKLNSIRVDVVDKPGYVEEHVIDHEGLAHMLGKNMNYKEQALTNDVESIAAIMRLREGYKSIYIERCKAIFITTNSSLAYLTKNFFSKELDVYDVPPILTDVVLTNVIWLKKPIKAPDLPVKKILADCYAATQPKEHLWRKYLEEINKLKDSGEITQDHYYTLRYNQMARDALMERTLGNESVFTEGTVKEILEVIDRRIKQAFEDELNDERKLRKIAQEQTASAEQQLEEIRSSVHSISNYISTIVVGFIGVAIIILEVYGCIIAWLISERISYSTG